MTQDMKKDMILPPVLFKKFSVKWYGAVSEHKKGRKI